MKKTFIFLIVNFFLINNALAEKNYLYCIETLDKARDHFMNEGDIESAAFIEYDDTKNTIKIHTVYPSAKTKPFLHIKKSKVEKTELGFQIPCDALTDFQLERRPERRSNIECRVKVV